MDNTFAAVVAVFLMAVILALYIMRRRVRQGKRTPKF
jgi:hypothetical protein